MASPHKYTVIGFYIDNNQPWIEWALARSPKEAARKAIKALAKVNGLEPSEDIAVVEVIKGYHQGTLINQKVCSLKSLKGNPSSL